MLAPLLGAQERLYPRHARKLSITPLISVAANDSPSLLRRANDVVLYWNRYAKAKQIALTLAREPERLRYPGAGPCLFTGESRKRTRPEAARDGHPHQCQREQVAIYLPW